MSARTCLKRLLFKPLLRLAKRLNRSGARDYLNLRHGVARLDRWLGREPTDVHRTTWELSQCTATWFDLPQSQSQSHRERVILYLHGGGFIFETPRMHGDLLARLCRAVAARGLMLNYRLAPEHPYPAATDDCLEAYRGLLDQGYAAQNIVIGGDSAGGNLTLVTLLRIRAAGLPLPAGAIALSPFTDALGASDSFARNARHDAMLTPHTYALVMDNYLPDTARRGEPWISPLRGDLEGLPPIFIMVGSGEMLLDDAVRFANRCPSATLEVWHGMPHVFPAIAFLPEARRALQRMTEVLRTLYASPVDDAPSLDAVLHPPQGEMLLAPSATSHYALAWGVLALLTLAVLLV
jgi:monoterpene epsilon-lactone hydrolase